MCDRHNKCALSTVSAFHVSQQVAPLGERLWAGRTCVRLLSRMHAHVAHKNILLREAARADGALERPLPRVDAVVPDQVRLVNERRLADLAPERSFASVQSTVPHQVILLLERTRADVAAEAPLTRVGADVDYHVTLLVGRVRAEVAVEDLLPVPVAGKGRRNLDTAAVRSSRVTAATGASVGTRVDYHVTLAVGSVRTEVAEEKLLSVPVSDNGRRDLHGGGESGVTIITTRVTVFFFFGRSLVLFGVQAGAARAAGFAETRVWPFRHVVAVLCQLNGLALASRWMRLQGRRGSSNPYLHAAGVTHHSLLRPRFFFVLNRSCE